MLLWIATVVISIHSGYVHGDLTPVSLLPLPQDGHYTAAAVEYHDGGMGPMFDFARSFINSALPGGFPTELVNDTLYKMDHGGLDVGSLGKQLLKKFAGYVFALLVGLLFVIILPIVGCCYCCCRKCGKCGGKRKQEVTSSMNRNRLIYSAVLFVLAVFTLTGNICTYVSNARMSVALGEMGDTMADNLDDIDSYLNLVEKQVVVLGIKNLDITETSIMAHMDAKKLEGEISEYVINSLSGGALQTMESNINATRDAFDDVETASQEVNSAFTQFRNSCPMSVCVLLPAQNPLATSTQFQAILTNYKPQFDAFAQNSVVDRVMATLSTDVHKHLGNVKKNRDNIKLAFQHSRTTVNEIVQNVKDFRTNAHNGMDIQEMKRKTKSFTADADKYDGYRYSVGAGLSAVTTLVVAFQFLGLAFGFVGYSRRVSPTQRGCVANAGGNMLIASVAFIFLFAPLLMLLTTLCFSMGSIFERFGCQPLSDPNLSVLDVLDPYVSTKGSLDAEFSDILKSCRDGQSAYTAFNLKHKFDLDDIDRKLQAEEKNIDQSLRTTLGGLSSMSRLDFGTVTGNSLTELSNSLVNIDFVTITSQLKTGVASVQHGISTTLDNYLTAMEKLTRALDKLHQSANNVPTWSAEFKAGMQKVTNDMTVKMTPLMNTFKDKIIDIAERYANSTKDNVKDHLGKCTPLWNLYQSVVVVSICKYTIDAFNGFWFSIGWCLFFFVPSIVIATKLAKHYRRMDEVEDRTMIKDESSIGYSSPSFRSNKVGHVDEPV